MAKKHLGRVLAAGFMSALLAGMMTAPAFAATSVSVVDSEGELTELEIGGEAVGGVTWTAENDITMKDAVVTDVQIEGDANVQFEGESTVENIIGTSEGNLNLIGNADVPAEQKPILNMGSADAEYSQIFAYENYETSEKGALAIIGLTVIFNSAVGYVHGCNSVTVDNSKLAVANGDEQTLAISADEEEGASLTITESVVDAGTDGVIYTYGPMTINNSDVTVRADFQPVEELIYSETGITLTSEKNGEVKEYTDEYGDLYYYVTTGQEDGVFLVASSTPGYYTGKAAAAKAMPKTADAVNGGVIAGLAVAALAAAGALALARRRVEI